MIGALHRVFRKLCEPAILFPGIAVILLTLLWSATAELAKLKESDAAHDAARTSRELLGTYEAQVVRALREIDQSLNLVKYSYERDHSKRTLVELADRGLLPSDLIFTVSIADQGGVILESTNASQQANVGDQDYFLAQQPQDTFFVGRPPTGTADTVELRFSRRLNGKDGSFDGVVIVSVAASYFVSGYEAAKLGSQGVLGMVGDDGIVRVRRSGESVFAGDAVDYPALLSKSSEPDADPTIGVDSWDGTPRWTGSRELFGFPLAVVVGLSVDEQMSAAHRAAHVYWWRAAVGSIVALLVTGALGRMSWQLAQGRIRESEAKLVHAQRIEYLAYHDGLTGLPNRSNFSKILSQSINEAARYQRQLAVAFLDLDRFKQINDTLGHDAGDQLLQEVAKRLRTCVRESDTVARLGGDEFVVILPELDSVHYAGDVAKKILAVMAKPFTLISHEFRVTASIGISSYPSDGPDEQTLTKNADIAMYKAKAEGKNNFQFYSESLSANSLERLTLESSLRHALERNEFRICYQTKRDIRTGQITGMEALLRWQHPDLGLVAPMQFIPIAEETGLIIPVGKWVLKTACAQNVAWQKAGAPRLSISVNLTARQLFDERLIEDITSVLLTTGMEPSLLEVEISERLLIREIDATLRILNGLKRLGLRISIDDFGTGYSSLTGLQSFPFDTIKIDGSLVRGIAADPDNTGFAESVIAMGRKLSRTVVAQGVETRAQAEFVQDHVCDEIQGFYFDRPLQAEEFTKLLMGPVSLGASDPLSRSA